MKARIVLHLWGHPLSGILSVESLGGTLCKLRTDGHEVG